MPSGILSLEQKTADLKLPRLIRSHILAIQVFQIFANSSFIVPFNFSFSVSALRVKRNFENYLFFQANKF
jgi:hypothetical protein